MLKAATVSASIALFAVLAIPSASQARPSYFDNFVTLYGVQESDDLHACGVCHFLWTGTGGRNLFGQAVEQQLYIGKTITQSLTDIETFDSDSDGFTNVDEILTYMTLPGYDCSNFQDAVGAPLGYDTYITPLVPTCLEPLDIDVSPGTIGFVADVGEVVSTTVTIRNNGSSDPVMVTDYQLLPGSDPTFSLANGPTPPFSIPLGGSETVDVVFAPPALTLASGTFRVSSDDPDEPDIDIPVSGLGLVEVLGPPADREACLSDVDKNFRRYSKTHFKEWSRCYVDEVTGVACDTGRRDLKLLKAEAKLRSKIGGEKDRKCEALFLTPSLLGIPETCGGSCDSISVNTMSEYVDCLICRQDEAMNQALIDSLGTAPPDLPGNTAGTVDAAKCQKKLSKGIQKALKGIHKSLGTCEVSNIQAVSPVDCPTAVAADIGKFQSKADSQIDACKDTTGLLGCHFEMSPVPTCLGDSALSIATDLVDQAFGLSE